MRWLGENCHGDPRRRSENITNGRVKSRIEGKWNCGPDTTAPGLGKESNGRLRLSACFIERAGAVGAPVPFSAVMITFSPGLGRSRKRCRDCLPHDRRNPPLEFPLLCTPLLLEVQDRIHCTHRPLPFSYRDSSSYSSPPLLKGLILHWQYGGNTPNCIHCNP
jgi:hypothetical protein